MYKRQLFILYTSGTTGKPKGVVHSTGGYATQVAFSTKYVFDLRDEDTYFCTADVGWVTGHSYIVYGPLMHGASVVMYEGAPDAPHKGRFWEIIDKWGVTIFYTCLLYTSLPGPAGEVGPAVLVTVVGQLRR